MNYTQNLALKKPTYSDESDIEILNENWEKIDANSVQVLNSLSDKVDKSQVLTDVPINAVFTDTIPNAADLGLDNLDNVKQMPISGGQFTGIAKANSNVEYSTKQVRNIILSTTEADISLMENGDIWIKYE